MKPEIINRGFTSMQVCVPESWDDERVVNFAELENPSGTTNGWAIRRQGDPLLEGDPERNSCDKHRNHVHIVLDA